MTAAQFSPGSLVTARGRDWIVLSGSDEEVLRVRPLTGSEEDQTLIHVALEPDGVRASQFPPPRVDQMGGAQDVGPITAWFQALIRRVLGNEASGREQRFYGVDL